MIGKQRFESNLAVLRGEHAIKALGESLAYAAHQRAHGRPEALAKMDAALKVGRGIASSIFRAIEKKQYPEKNSRVSPEEAEKWANAAIEAAQEVLTLAALEAKAKREAREARKAEKAEVPEEGMQEVAFAVIVNGELHGLTPQEAEAAWASIVAMREAKTAGKDAAEIQRGHDIALALALAA